MYNLIQSLVISRLDYGNGILLGLSGKLSQRLQCVMNSAARLITGVKRSDHITPTLKQLHWLPINRRIQFKVMCFTFKAINGAAPSYIQDLVQTYVPTRSVR